MRNLYMFTAVAAFLSTGCVPTKFVESSDPQTEEIVIYSKNGRLIAQVGGKEAKIRDCSTLVVRCVQIQDILTFIYPRKCPFGQGYEALRWKQDDVETFLSIPYPDVGLPAGVYMSSLSDRISYDYDTKQGLTKIVVAKQPVSQKGHNRSDYEHNYRVKYPAGDFNKFICT